VADAVAGLQARWGAAAPRIVGALALAPAPAPDGVAPDDIVPVSDPRPDDRVVRTGFAALDAILGPGGLPRAASVAIRGDGSSGRTTLALRTVAEAQSAGAVVAWLDLSRSFDPVEAVARGVRLEWFVVITPQSLDEGLSIAGSLLAGRSIDLLVLDLPGGRLARTDRPARIADRLHRLTALARRAEILLLILDAPSLGGGLATAVAESTGIRLELARRSWVRLGRDVVGQRTEAFVAHNRHGPPGRRATLRILYAEGGERDACLARDTLLFDTLDGSTPPDAARVAHASDASVVAARSVVRPNEGRSLHQPHTTDEPGPVEVDPVLLVHGETPGPAPADGAGDGACIRRTPIAPIAPIPIHAPDHEAPDREIHDATPAPLPAAPPAPPGAGPSLRALPDRPARAGRPAVGSGSGHRRQSGRQGARRSPGDAARERPSARS
jgi:recombination protein RecA